MVVGFVGVVRLSPNIVADGSVGCCLVSVAGEGGGRGRSDKTIAIVDGEDFFSGRFLLVFFVYPSPFTPNVLVHKRPTCVLDKPPKKFLITINHNHQLSTELKRRKTYESKPEMQQRTQHF